MENNNSKICFVLLPGLAPDNYPVLGLKAAFESHGYSAIATSFFGEENVRDFPKLTAGNCVNNIGKIIEEASRKYDMVFGIGISLGGALLLEYAKKNDNLDGIVSIGTPFRLRHRKMIGLAQKVYPFIHPIWKHLQKIKKLRLLPLGAGNMTINFFEGQFLKDLEQIKTSVLFLHSKKDDVADYNALFEFVPKLENAKRKITFFDNGNHVIDYNHEPIIGYALDYFGLNGHAEHADLGNEGLEMELCPEKIHKTI